MNTNFLNVKILICFNNDADRVWISNIICTFFVIVAPFTFGLLKGKSSRRSLGNRRFKVACRDIYVQSFLIGCSEVECMNKQSSTEARSFALEFRLSRGANIWGELNVSLWTAQRRAEYRHETSVSGSAVIHWTYTPCVKTALSSEHRLSS